MNPITLRASRFLCLLALSTPFLKSAADEFQNESKTYLRSDVGYAVQDQLKITMGGFKYDLNTKDGVRCDLVFGYRLGPVFSVEAEGGMAFTRLDDVGQHDYYQVPALVNLAWNYPGKKFRPFFSLGAGGAELIAVARKLPSGSSAPTTESDFVACGQFATGVHYRLSKCVELGLGYKLLIVGPATFKSVEIDTGRTQSFFASLRYNF